jgi:hypothetical protein
MILEAEAAARKYAAAQVKADRISVAAIQTSQPKYLLFGEDPRRPLCVVQFGPEPPLRRVYEVLRTLHPLLPTSVPAPIACEPWARDTQVFIQGGLEGAPWFELQRRCASAAEWLHLGRVALEALHRLQEAVRSTAASRAVAPADELRDALEHAVRHGMELSHSALTRVRQTIEHLSALGTISGFPQHGDFSLNNVLLASDGTVSIIDFEEFGLTCMPMQDEIGLAVSMAALAPARCSHLSLDVYLREALAKTTTFSPDQLIGLLFYYLLWRIRLTHGISRRAAGRVWLISALEQSASGQLMNL